jgi:hypothetical protein
MKLSDCQQWELFWEGLPKALCYVIGDHLEQTKDAYDTEEAPNVMKIVFLSYLNTNVNISNT